MDLSKIKELIELVQETKIAEIEIREGETVVHIKNQVAQPAIPYPHLPGHPLPTAVTGSHLKSQKKCQKMNLCSRGM